MNLSPVFSLPPLPVSQSNMMRDLKPATECCAEDLKQYQAAHGGRDIAMQGDYHAESKLIALLIQKALSRFLRDMQVGSPKDAAMLFQLSMSSLAEGDGISGEI